jgi:hypothetical protein
MKHSLESLPRRIFLDSCTAQTLRNYCGYIYESEPIPDSYRIHRVTDAISNIEASATSSWSTSARNSNDRVARQLAGSARHGSPNKFVS